MKNNLVLVRSGGDVASGTIQRLRKMGFDVVVTEIKNPTMIRRTVSYGQAVFDGETEFEGVKAIYTNLSGAKNLLKNRIVPVVTEDIGEVLEVLKPKIVVDGILAKKNLGTTRDMAKIVIGLGPGFTAGEDVDAVVETNRGHDLGRVILEGSGEKNTGIPGVIGGYTSERVLYATKDGKAKNQYQIGDMVKAGEGIIEIEGEMVMSKISGVIRGLIQEGSMVHQGMKVGDVDPRGEKRYCYSISDKARAIAGGVVEAIFTLENR